MLTSDSSVKGAGDYDAFLDDILGRNLNDFCRVVLDTLQFPILVVEQNARIVDCNLTAAHFLASDRKLVLNHRPGEVLHCIHSNDVAEGCGKGAACINCTIRACVNQSLNNQCSMQQKVLFEMAGNDGEPRTIEFLVRTSPLEYASHKYVLLVMEDLSTVRSILE
jgi:hypothetical protein